MSSYPKPDLSEESGIVDRLYNWADERLGLTDLIAFATHKQVPQHKHSFW